MLVAPGTILTGEWKAGGDRWASPLINEVRTRSYLSADASNMSRVNGSQVLKVHRRRALYLCLSTNAPDKHVYSRFYLLLFSLSSSIASIAYRKLFLGRIESDEKDYSLVLGKYLCLAATLSLKKSDSVMRGGIEGG